MRNVAVPMDQQVPFGFESSPNDDEMLSGDEPEDPLDDDHQPDDDLDMPGGIKDSGEPHDPSSPSTPFSNPDVPIEEITDPGQDDDPSPGHDPTDEPVRVQRKQGQISFDSTDALPKTKAKVIIKRPKVQLAGHVQPVSVQFQLRSMMMKKMKDLHITLKPPVQIIIPFHCLRLHQRHLCQVTMRSQRNSSPHRKHQNWYHHKTMMKQNHTTLMTLLV